MANGIAFHLGGIKISALTAGIAGSIVIHAGILTGSYAVFTSVSDHDDIQTETLYARGEPIQVRLIESDQIDVVPDDLGIEVDPDMTTIDDVEEPSPVEPVDITEPSEPTNVETGFPEMSVEQMESETESEQQLQELLITLCDDFFDSLAQTMELIESRLSKRTPRDQRIASSPTQSPVTTKVESLPPVKKTVLIKPTTASEKSTIPKPKPALTNAKPPTPSAPTQAGIESGAQAVDLPRPVYPSRSIRRGQEGTVLVDVEVLANGRVGQVKVHTSSGYKLLDKAGLAAAKKGRFQPAKHDGVPFTSHVVVPFEFKLR